MAKLLWIDFSSRKYIQALNEILNKVIDEFRLKFLEFWSQIYQINP